MNEFQKVIISFGLLIILCICCFLGGYLFCNRQAIKRINESNNQLAEQQRQFDIAIREAEERIRIADERLRNIGAELYQQVSNNGATTEELSGIIEQIRKQKLNL